MSAKACSEKPVDEDDSVVMQEIEDCVEAALNEGSTNDTVAIFDDCTKKVQESRADVKSCAGKSKGFQNILQKAKEIIGEVKEKIKKGGEVFKKAFKKLHEGLSGLVSKIGDEFKKFFQNLTKLGKDSTANDEYSDDE